MQETVKVSAELLALLQSRKVFSGLRSQSRWRVGQILGVHRHARLEPYVSILSGPYVPFVMGAFSYSHSDLAHHVKIGRYCSIGSGVAWMGGDHPVDWATTSPAAYDAGPLPGIGAYLAERGVEPARRPRPPPPARW